MSRFASLVPGVAITCALLLLTGCAAEETLPAPDVSSQESSLDTSEPATATILDVEPDRDAPGIVDPAGARQLAPPGIHDLPSGRTQVIGILEPDGDGWRISTQLPERGVAPLTAPVRLGGLETFRHQPLENLEGDYVVAEGNLSGEASPNYSGTLRTTSIDRIENVIMYGSSPGTRPEGMTDYGGKMLRGIPYRFARIEKPGLFELGDGRVRLVGVFFPGSSSGKAQVMDMMPYGNPAHFASVAYLEDGFEPVGGAESWRGEYVAVEGVRAGEVHRHGLGAGQPSAVVRVDTIERIPVPEF